MSGLKSEVDSLYNAMVNGPNVTLTRYPIAAIGVAMTEAGAAAYAYKAAGAGQVALTGMLAVNNAAGIWICGAGLLTPSVTTTTYILWVGRGVATAPAIIACELEFQGIISAGVAAGLIVAMLPSTVMLPYPLYVTAGVGVALDMATSGNAAETARASVVIATGLGA